MASCSTDNPVNIEYVVIEIPPSANFDKILEIAPKNNVLVCWNFDDTIVDHGQKIFNHLLQSFSWTLTNSANHVLDGDCSNNALFE